MNWAGMGLYLFKRLFCWAYYWREFCVSNWVGLYNKNSLHIKQLTLTVHGLIFGRVYCRKDICVPEWGEAGSLFTEGLVNVIVILRYTDKILRYLLTAISCSEAVRFILRKWSVFSVQERYIGVR